MMGTFVDDAIYNYLNTDDEPANDVDLFFNNSGGIRTDWCWDGTNWISPSPSTCTASGTHAPGLLTYGHMFTILPFGNATIIGKMTGAQILEVINNGPLIAGVIQPAGLKYKYYKYTDTLARHPGNPPPSSQHILMLGAPTMSRFTTRASSSWLPLDLKKTYNVGTNEFLAPGGGDGYNAFKYMTNVMYWGDMLNAVNAYVAANYGTPATAYKGPNGDGTLDGRIIRDGDGDNTYDGGNEIVPLTILHHNDLHGNLYKRLPYVGYTQLATLIKQEKLHNPRPHPPAQFGRQYPGRRYELLLQDRADRCHIRRNRDHGSALHIQPLIKVFNTMGYDAMTLGNHEFNFGKDVFTSVIGPGHFPAPASQRHRRLIIPMD